MESTEHMMINYP